MRSIILIFCLTASLSVFSQSTIIGPNANVGIGNSNPYYILDVSQRARIRSGLETAGIWFSKTTNNVNEGAFFGNINDTQTGIWIGNAWRFGLNTSGIVNVPNLAGAGTRSLGADASGNIVALPTQSTNTVAFATARYQEIGYELSSSSWLQVTLTQEDYDIGNNFNLGVFTAPSAGVYYFNVNLSWTPNATGFRAIDLKKNNVSIKPHLVNATSAEVNLIQNFTTSLYLNANDQITLWIYQTSGSPLNFVFGYRDPVFFSGYKIN